MTKRYGRNQKRAALKRIAELERAVDYSQKRIEELEFLGRHNADILEETAAVLGNHFVTLPPATVEIQHIDRLAHGWRVPVARNHRPPRGYFEGELPSSVFLEQVLPIIRGGHIVDELRKRVHFRIEYQEQNVGYAIDDISLRYLPDAKTHIAKEMSRFLMRNLGYMPAEAAINER